MSWSGHCKHLLGKLYATLELDDSLDFSIANVPCAEENYRTCMERFPGFPQIRVYDNGKVVCNYQGNRDPVVMKAAIRAGVCPGYNDEL